MSAKTMTASGRRGGARSVALGAALLAAATAAHAAAGREAHHATAQEAEAGPGTPRARDAGAGTHGMGHGAHGAHGVHGAHGAYGAGGEGPGTQQDSRGAAGHGAHDAHSGAGPGATGTAPGAGHGAHDRPAAGAARGADPGGERRADHGAPGADHGAPAPHGAAPAGAAGAHGDMDMDAMMKSMQGGRPPPDARDPHAYSGGLMPAPMPGMDMADHEPFARLLVDRLETHLRRRGEGSVQVLDAQAWWGGDIDKLWLKLDGERSGGRQGATRAEALWDRAVAPFWSVQAGVRRDFGDGPGRDWAALGVQGLAPYWFELQATAYAGPGGRTALRVEAEYELLFTQRLILQPLVKASLYGRDDRARGIGAGLSHVEAGLRLRYEFSRKFAPYIGVSTERDFGRTADFARVAGEPVRHTRWLAGLRMWY